MCLLFVILLADPQTSRKTISKNIGVSCLVLTWLEWRYTPSLGEKSNECYVVRLETSKFYSQTKRKGFIAWVEGQAVKRFNSD